MSYIVNLPNDFLVELVMGNTEREFYKILSEDPNREDARGMYADWLEEHGRGKSAEMLRNGTLFPKRIPYNSIMRPLFLTSGGQITNELPMSGSYGYMIGYGPIMSGAPNIGDHIRCSLETR